LNVNTDLSFYDLIVPCGIVGRGVTSMQTLLSRPLDMREVAEQYIPEFSAVFHRTMIRMDERGLAGELGIFADAATGPEAWGKTVA
jgi:lipoate-protein ligase B